MDDFYFTAIIPAENKNQYDSINKTLQEITGNNVLKENSMEGKCAFFNHWLFSIYKLNAEVGNKNVSYTIYVTFASMKPQLEKNIGKNYAEILPEQLSNRESRNP